MVCPPPQFKKIQEKKFVSSQIRLDHFPHLRGQLWGVTTSQYHRFLSIFWHVGLRRCVSLGWVHSGVSLSVWPLAVVRLAFTDKIRLTGREMLLYLCWLLFSNQWQWNKQTLVPKRIFTVVHTQSLYATLLRAFSQLGENSSAGHVFSPLFQNTSFSLFDFILKRCCKVKNKFHNNLWQGLLFRYVYFLFSISHSNRPKMRGKESRVLKKPIIFCAKELIHTVGNKWDHNKALLKIWRESDKRAILFFQTKKKSIGNGIHCRPTRPRTFLTYQLTSHCTYNGRVLTLLCVSVRTLLIFVYMYARWQTCKRTQVVRGWALGLKKKATYERRIQKVKIIPQSLAAPSPQEMS